MNRVEEIYKRHIRPLSVEERLRILEMTARDLADLPSDRVNKTYNIMELHGLGKEIWEGIDAQDYVNKLRDEWENPQ